MDINANSRNAIKKIVKWIGSALTIVCLIYIAYLLISMDINWNELFNRSSDLYFFIVVCVLSLLQYSLGAYGWKFVLYAISNQKIKFSPVLDVYSRSNLAKYLPGNVMHFAGRNLLGDRLGIRQIDIALSTIVEIILQFLSAVILSIVLSLNYLIEVILMIFKNRTYYIVFSCIVVLGLLVVCIAVLYLRKFGIERIRDKYVHLLTKKSLLLIFRAFMIYILTLLILGIINLIIVMCILQGQIPEDGYLTIISITIISWLAGFVVPGAPGGIGIRETISITLMEPVLGLEVVTLSAILLRLVNISGDFLLFGCNVVWQKILKNRLRQNVENTPLQ